MSRYYWGFQPQPTVAVRKLKAEQTIARMRKKGAELSPVSLEGRTIAKTFWGKAWCDNVESYRDYAYRLERGRSYVRSGAVIDLKISKGEVEALVIGSGRNPYRISIRIDKMKKSDWDALVKRSTGKVASLMALAQGKLPQEMLEDFCNPETGLFPKPKEIHFDCSCPDGAYCCKHVAAVLYGIGARLDKEPELFFTLRGIDPNSIVASEMVETLTGETENELEGANLGDVFGISLDGDAAAVAESPGEAAPEKAPEAAPEKKKKRGRPAKKKGATPLSPAERVRALRQKMGLSQAAFGKEIGTYQAVVSQMELGKAPSQFARALPLIERLEEKYGLAQ